MADNKFKVRYGLTVGDGDRATISGTTGDIATDGDLSVTGSALVNANLTVNGTATLGNAVGDTVTINGDAVINNALTIGSSTGDTVTVNSQVAGNIAFTNNSTTTSRGVSGTVGTNDFWRFGGAAAGVNEGYAEIATGDDGTEPVYVRQYTGATPTRTATLLDASGNTQLPGDLTIQGGELTISAPGYIYSDSGLAIQVSGNDAIVSGDITVTAGDIKSSTATAITIAGEDAEVKGQLRVSGDVIRKSGGNSVISFSGTNLVTVAGDLVVGGNTIRSSTAEALELSGADVTAQGNLTVTGDLTVNGTTTTINTENLLVEDNIVTLNSNVTGTPATNAGIEIERGDLANTQLLWNESALRWSSTVDGTVYLNLPNQNLDTTSDVQFDVVDATQFEAVDSVATSGAPLLANGQILNYATFNATGVASGSVPTLGVLVENYTTENGTVTPGNGGAVIVVDHGQNRSGGTNITAGVPSLTLESTRGTALTPTATGNNDTIGVINMSGHDGVRGLGTDVVAASVQMVGLAAGAYTNDGTYTTNAGGGLIVRTQPQNLRATSASRQNIFTTGYTLVTGAPPTQNILWNNNSMSTQYDAAGTAINGHGKQSHIYTHPDINYYGVPSQSTGNADNTNILGTNRLNFYTSRQSGFLNRRDAVENNDTLAEIRVFGQTLNNTSAAGSQTGTLAWTAAENFTTTRRGSKFTVQTGEIGTANTLSNRLEIDSNNATITTTRTRFVTPGTSNYGGEISQKVGILNGASGYDKTTELSVTALTTDGTSAATYETKTNRYNGTNYSPTQSGDQLGRFTFLGNYGSGTDSLSVNAAGTITVRAAENFTATASGTSLALTVNKLGTNDGLNALDLSSAQSTYRSDIIAFQDSALAPLVGGKIDYNRVYGQWEQDGPVTPAAANTSYVFAPGNAIDTNIASIVSTSRITPGAAGKYNLQFSLQWLNGANSEYRFYVWLRKNGVNVANSTGDVTCAKSASGVSGWNYIVSSANATDYFELAYQVESTDITFPYVATFGTAPNDVPACPALITTLTPIGA